MAELMAELMAEPRRMEDCLSGNYTSRSCLNMLQLCMDCRLYMYIFLHVAALKPVWNHQKKTLPTPVPEVSMLIFSGMVQTQPSHQFPTMYQHLSSIVYQHSLPGRIPLSFNTPELRSPIGVNPCKSPDAPWSLVFVSGPWDQINLAVHGVQQDPASESSLVPRD